MCGPWKNTWTHGSRTRGTASSPWRSCGNGPPNCPGTRRSWRIARRPFGGTRRCGSSRGPGSGRQATWTAGSSPGRLRSKKAGDPSTPKGLHIPAIEADRRLWSSSLLPRDHPTDRFLAGRSDGQDGGGQHEQAGRAGNEPAREQLADSQPRVELVDVGGALRVYEHLGKPDGAHEVDQEQVVAPQAHPKRHERSGRETRMLQVPRKLLSPGGLLVGRGWAQPPMEVVCFQHLEPPHGVEQVAVPPGLDEDADADEGKTEQQGEMRYARRSQGERRDPCAQENRPVARRIQPAPPHGHPLHLTPVEMHHRLVESLRRSRAVQ